MAYDPFEGKAHTVDAPASHAFAVTPDDANDLGVVARGLYVGAGGDVALRTPSGEDVTFSNVSGGAILPVRALRVLATGTTASAIIGLY